MKNCSLVQILWVARHFFNMRFLAILPPLAMAIFALCHPTGVHITRPKMLRLTNGFWENTSNLAGRVFRGVRHYSILFYSTKLVPPPFFAVRTSNSYCYYIHYSTQIKLLLAASTVLVLVECLIYIIK